MCMTFLSVSDYLYKEPVGIEETKYPSPEKLARKILIKVCLMCNNIDYLLYDYLLFKCMYTKIFLFN